MPAPFDVLVELASTEVFFLTRARGRDDISGCFVQDHPEDPEVSGAFGENRHFHAGEHVIGSGPLTTPLAGRQWDGPILEAS